MHLEVGRLVRLILSQFKRPSQGSASGRVVGAVRTAVPQTLAGLACRQALLHLTTAL